MVVILMEEGGNNYEVNRHWKLKALDKKKKQRDDGDSDDDLRAESPLTP